MDVSAYTHAHVAYMYMYILHMNEYSLCALQLSRGSRRQDVHALYTCTRTHHRCVVHSLRFSDLHVYTPLGIPWSLLLTTSTWGRGEACVDVARYLCTCNYVHVQGLHLGIPWNPLSIKQAFGEGGEGYSCRCGWDNYMSLACIRDYKVKGLEIPKGNLRTSWDSSQLTRYSS